MDTEKTNDVDQLFKLINDYLAKENIKDRNKCHKALDYLKEGIKKIKELHDAGLALQFKKRWLKIKTKLKATSEPVKFRIREVEIEKIIQSCKSVHAKV